MRLRTLLLLIALFGLTACKVDLYSDLEEHEATEMMALLLENGMAAEKAPGKDGVWLLRVEEADISGAVALLKQRGFPRQNYESMGVVFKKEGLISSPAEERIRFIYGLSQELGATIAQIDGVLSSRVHIVLPENDPLSDTVLPSSASVFIKFRPGSTVVEHIPKIKKMVVNSIEGLTYDKVTVASFAGVGVVSAPRTPYKTAFGVRIHPSSYGVFAVLVGLLFTALSGLAGYLVWIKWSETRPAPEVSHV